MFDWLPWLFYTNFFILNRKVIQFLLPQPKNRPRAYAGYIVTSVPLAGERTARQGGVKCGRWAGVAGTIYWRRRVSSEHLARLTGQSSRWPLRNDRSTSTCCDVIHLPASENYYYYYYDDVEHENCHLSSLSSAALWWACISASFII